MSSLTSPGSSETISTTAIDATPVAGTPPATRAQLWLSKIAKSKRERMDMVPDWALNVDYRRGKPFQEDSDEDRIRVPIDWSMTKAKQAQLFSQVPEVRLTEKNPKFKLLVPMFGKKLNDIASEARVGVALDEDLPDCINAAGFGAVYVGYETLTEMRDVPTVTPEMAQQLQTTGQQVPVKSMAVVADYRYTVTRISPADLLWDLSFTGSDFNDSPWLGNSGRVTWDAVPTSWKKSEQNPHGITPEDKDKVCGGDSRTVKDVIGSDDSMQRFQDTNVVEYDQLFYWRYKFHAEETNFKAIQHMVFVRGKNEPVLDQPWDGQRLVPQGQRKVLRGARKFPIQVLTLTYISDETIPPSDSAMARPQVDELNESRSQMVKNRKNSLPLRWFNVNLVDQQVQTNIMRGTWQGMVPMNGDGARAMGEVARASYPQEDYNFDNIAKADVRETWQVEDAVNGGPAIRSATEAHNRQQNFQTRVSYERARTAAHFVSIMEVLAGLVSLYGPWSNEEQQQLQQAGIDPTELSDCYAFKVRPDSTQLLDSEQRIERLMRFLNMTAKSGFIDPVPIIAELAELHGLDPAVVIHQPEGQGPEPIKASMALKGEDLSNPQVVAMLIHTKQMFTPEELNEAKILLAKLPEQPTATPPPDGPDAGPGGPAASGPPPGGPTPTGAPAGGRTVRPAEPPSAHPGWQPMARIEKRQDDGK